MLQYYTRGGENVKWLRVLCTLPDNLTSFLACTSDVSQLPVPSAPWDQPPSFGILGYLYTNGIHLHRQMICKNRSQKILVHTYIHELTNRKLKKEKKTSIGTVISFQKL